MTIFGGGTNQESSKRWHMYVLASGLLLDQSRVSNVSCSGKRIHAFAGNVT